MLFAIVGCSDVGVDIVEDDLVENNVPDDDVPEDDTVETTDRAISFSSIETKGTVIEDDEFTSFGVYCYYVPEDGSVDYKSTTPQYMYNTNVLFNSTSGLWEYSPLKYWPEYNTDALIFLGYMPYSVDHSDVYVDVTNTNEAVIVYNSPSTMLETVDFVVASTYSTGDDWEQTVPLNFEHLLTRVKFAFRNDVISSESGTTSEDDDAEEDVETLYSMMIKSIKLVNVRTKSSYTTTKNDQTGEMIISYCDNGEKNSGTITATTGGGGLEEVYVMYNSEDIYKYTDITTEDEYLFIDTNLVSDDVTIWLEAEIDVYVYDDDFKTNTLSITNTVIKDITSVFRDMEDKGSYTLQLSYQPIEGSALWVYSLEYWEDIYNQNDM